MPLFLQKEYPQSLSLFVWEVKEDVSFFTDFLLQEEKEYLFNISQNKKQLEFASIRYLAQLVCKDFLALSYKGIDKDEYGKPYFKGISYEISISHCLPYVGIVLHASKAVGIDIEQEQSKLLQVAPRVFSEEELLFCGKNLRKACIMWASKETLYKIYAKKGLTFRTDLLIDAFGEDEKSIQAKICTAHYQQSYLLHYEELSSRFHLCCGM